MNVILILGYNWRHLSSLFLSDFVWSLFAGRSTKSLILTLLITRDNKSIMSFTPMLLVDFALTELITVSIERHMGRGVMHEYL